MTAHCDPPLDSEAIGATKCSPAALLLSNKANEDVLLCSVCNERE